MVFTLNAISLSNSIATPLSWCCHYWFIIDIIIDIDIIIVIIDFDFDFDIDIDIEI